MIYENQLNKFNIKDYWFLNEIHMKNNHIF